MLKNHEKKDILKRLEKIRKKDMQQALFYCWDLLPKDIQENFIYFCLRYTQRSYADCLSGWESGWRKEHKPYILWLKGKFHNPITEREKKQNGVVILNVYNR